MTHDDHDDEHDRGLAHDRHRLLALVEPRLVSRRRLLALAGAGAGALALAACGSGSSRSSATAATTASTTAASATATAGDAATPIPEETAGPYPGDGTNGPNALARSGIVRRDVRPSLGSGTVATGVPVTLTLRVVAAGTGRALAGAAVYLWHADQLGRYSMYSSGVTGETYLRGVQAAGPDGSVTFDTVFPGCYDGRWPHMHVEVYPSLDAATAARGRLATSQLAMPEDVCHAVYATDGYGASVTNLRRVTLATDMVFADGATRQTPTMAGSAPAGYTAALLVPVRG